MKRKILIVDDDALLQLTFPEIFDSESYVLKSLLDIRDLDAELREFKPDLILLDIWIGNIDGRVVCNFIKSHEQTSLIPIVLMSAMPIDIDDAHCQPDAILQKPFKIHELFELIETLFVEGEATHL